MADVAIVYETVDGQTAKAADHMALALRRRGHEVTVRDARRARRLDPRAYDGVIIGGPVHVGRYPPSLAEFVRAHLEALNERPSAFFSLSLRIRAGEEGRHEAEGYVDSFLRDTGWRPGVTGSFAGALAYRRYGFLKRWMMRSIARRSGNETDTSRDYEYTDWDAVARFAEEFADHVARPPPPRYRPPSREEEVSPPVG